MIVLCFVMSADWLWWLKIGSDKGNWAGVDSNH